MFHVNKVFSFFLCTFEKKIEITEFYCLVDGVNGKLTAGCSSLKDTVIHNLG